jgi:fructosamine-3-kinase
MTYQGWKNHPTWLVWVWLENDAALYSYCQEIKAESQDVREIADSIKQMIEDAKPQSSDLWGDLIDSALAEVDWKEIATNLLED